MPAQIKRLENTLSMELTEIKKTPLYDTHIKLGARMMPFGGYEMPVQYTGIVAEHMAVRSNAGLFDVSHMGEFIIEGDNALSFIQHLITNDASKLYDGKALYTVMCYDDGGIVDDLLVYRFSQTRYMLVVNASNIAKDFAWIKSRPGSDQINLSDISDHTALLALQGPLAIQIAQELTDIALSEIKYYHFTTPLPSSFLNLENVVLSHTGYTGESGLEIYCNSGDVQRVWNAVMEAGQKHGLLPAGLGARDTLRLESGYCLYGNDITSETSPYAAGLGWITKPDKGDFVGRTALLEIKEKSPKHKLVGFILEERGIPRADYPILNEQGNVIGRVTSGSQSPILNKGIGLGYVLNDPTYTKPESNLYIEVRKKRLRATVSKPPFHKS